MRKSRFTEEQIIAALKEHGAGTPAKELCRRLGAFPLFQLRSALLVKPGARMALFERGCLE
jgi:hypothetical protein